MSIPIAMVDYGVILLLCFGYENIYNTRFMHGIKVMEE
jgi:hypothetical protein